MAKRRYDSSQAKRKLALKVRALRKQRGWTLEETEDYGWKSWRQLQRIESGHNVTLETIVKLANLFDVHPVEFLKGI